MGGPDPFRNVAIVVAVVALASAVAALVATIVQTKSLETARTLSTRAAQAPASRQRRFGRLLGPPMAAFAIAIALFGTIAAVTGYAPFATGTWARWDSIHYLQIAHHGYRLGPCFVPGGPECLNAGWFPGYAWVVGALHDLGLKLGTAGVLVALAFAFGALVVLWLGPLRAQVTAASIGALAYAAVAPGVIWQHAQFPLSMLVFFVLLSAWLAARGRLVGAGVCGAVAATCYPLGVLLAPALAVALLIVRRPEPWRPRLAAAAQVAGLTFVGFALVMVVQRWQTGEWWRFFAIQEHHLRSPLGALVGAARQLVDGGVWDKPELAAAHTLLTAVVVVLALVTCVRQRDRLAAIDVLVLAMVLAMWIVPLSQTDLSNYRMESALAPVAAILRRLPGPMVWGLAAAAAMLALPTAVGFFNNWLG